MKSDKQIEDLVRELGDEAPRAPWGFQAKLRESFASGELARKERIDAGDSQDDPLVEAIRGLPCESPPADFQAGLREKFARGEIETASTVVTPRKRPPVLSLVAALASAAAILAAVFLWPAGDRVDTPDTTNQLASWSVKAPVGETNLLVDGVERTFAPGADLSALREASELGVDTGALELELGDDILVRLREGAVLEENPLEEGSSRPTIALAEGHLLVDFRANADRKILFLRTAWHELEVRPGTRMALTFDPLEESVTVLEGEVRMIDPSSPIVEPYIVDAGDVFFHFPNQPPIEVPISTCKNSEEYMVILDELMALR